MTCKYSDCYGLTSVTIPSSVTNIGNDVFRNCSGLTSIAIFSSLTKISDYMFNDCTNLTTITIPSSVTTIGNYAFLGCSSLTSIVIPTNVTHIGSSAFNGCSNLKSITIPPSVKVIQQFAFNNCNGLTSVDIADIEAWCKIDFGSQSSNPLWYAHHLYQSGEEVKELIIPSSVTTIGSSTFCNCYGLNSVVFHENVSGIGAYAFQNCIGLKSVYIPDGVTSIGSYAFYGCNGLKILSIGRGLLSIGPQAFASCKSIEDVYCYSITLPPMQGNTFNDSNIDNATLHVFAESIDLYRSSSLFGKFGQIIPIEEQCATPTITYANGKVRFACETEGVEFVPTVTCTPNKLQNGNELELGGTFTVSVYAVKDGYDNSDTSTMTINMSQIGDVNADGELNAADITAVVNAILGK